MIISQTPYRVSFAGGGTDLPSFYQKEMGAVLSVGLSQHMYVTVSPRFKASTRIAYTRTEIADSYRSDRAHHRPRGAAHDRAWVNISKSPLLAMCHLGLVWVLVVAWRWV